MFRFIVLFLSAVKLTVIKGRVMTRIPADKCILNESISAVGELATYGKKRNGGRNDAQPPAWITCKYKRRGVGMVDKGGQEQWQVRRGAENGSQIQGKYHFCPCREFYFVNHLLLIAFM